VSAHHDFTDLLRGLAGNGLGSHAPVLLRSDAEDVLHNGAASRACAEAPLRDRRALETSRVESVITALEGGSVTACPSCAWDALELVGSSAAARVLVEADFAAQKERAATDAADLAARGTLADLERSWKDLSLLSALDADLRESLGEARSVVLARLAGELRGDFEHFVARTAAQEVLGGTRGLSGLEAPLMALRLPSLVEDLTEELLSDSSCVLVETYTHYTRLHSSDLLLMGAQAKALNASLVMLSRTHFELLTRRELLPVTTSLVLEEAPAAAVLEALAVLHDPKGTGKASTLAGALEVASAL
jgi:hypothetical protein